jgi:uncharacterized protein YjbI with pentapeptide repeats
METSQNEESKIKKQKRDWIALLLIPVISAAISAAIGGIIIYINNHINNTEQQKSAAVSNIRQQKLEDSKQREAVLTQYIQNMTELLQDKDHPLLKSKENDVSRNTAYTLTRTTLQQLTSEEDKNSQNKNKGSVLKLLSDSSLIKIPNPIVMLGSAVVSDMDFTGAYLPEGYLEEAALSNVNLSNANLAGAYLNMANLIATRLNNANLKNAQLDNAYLFQTYLFNTKNLTNAQIKSACNWKSAVYTEADENLKPKDAQANQKRIQEIENDKASDPKKPVDCSQWKEQGLAID